MKTQVNYEIQKEKGEIVEKGYIIVEDGQGFYEPLCSICRLFCRCSVEGEQGFYEPESTYPEGSVDIDTYIFLHRIFKVHRHRSWILVDINTYTFLLHVKWDGRYGEKYEYEDGEYTITINPDEK